MRKITDLIARKPAAVFIAPDPGIDKQWKNLPVIDMNPPFAYKDTAPGNISFPFIGFLKTEVGKALLSGQDGAWDKPGEIKDVSMVLSASAMDEDLQAWNVAGVVAGRDPVLKDQIVVVSAHLDHLASAPGQLLPRRK